MKLSRHQFLHLAAGAAAFPAVSGIATAQTYPARRERLIVPGAAGGPSRWSTECSGERESLRSELVVEVRFDHVILLLPAIAFATALS
jgi:tripartite-type tricarboxylate transporter receptor subunit TctC